jgi:hypothetical protein
MSQNDIPDGSPKGDPDHMDDERFEDLPTREDSSLRLSLASKQGYVRDLTNAVRTKGLKGLLVSGRPGIGKSHMIREFLGDPGGYVPLRGMLSRRQAIERFQEFPDSLFVFDDVCGCSSDPAFFQILLHALGGGPNDDRVISYDVKGKTESIPFTGSMLFIGNSAFRGAPRTVIDALESRVQTVVYDPSREELEWQMYRVAEAGIDGMPPAESIRLVSFMLRECRLAEREPEMRLLIEKILPIYRQAQREETCCSWDELIRQIVWTPTTSAKRPRSDAELRELLLELKQSVGSTPERVERYKALTGRSRASYFRDLTRLLGEDEDEDRPQTPVS